MSTVSVIIPAFNAARYLPDAIGSCLDQTFKDIEIIVVDDGSTDNTCEVVASFPVRYLYQPNKGVSAARNAGWALATGEYLQFLDADDVLLPTKIEKSLAAFTPDVDLVYTGYQHRSADLRQPMPTPCREMPEGDVLPHLLGLASTLFPLHAAIVRRSAADRTSRFPEQFRSAEDWHFWVELAAHGARFRYLDEVLVWYRITPGSLSKDGLGLAHNELAAAHAIGKLPPLAGVDLTRIVSKRQGRLHYRLAMENWAQGKRKDARRHFREALRVLEKSSGQYLVYAYLIGATYVTTPQCATALWTLLRRSIGKAKSEILKA